MASIIPGETNIDNNRFVDGIVQVKPYFPKICIIPRWLLAFLFILAVLAGLCLVLLCILLALKTRRKKENSVEKSSTLQPKTQPEKIRDEALTLKKTKICDVCGREFPAVYTFCPYCMTFNGKDYLSGSFKD